MAVVVFNRQSSRRGFGTAIAYKHTVNDEPCYDQTCELCYGEDAVPANLKERSDGDGDIAENS